MVIIRVPEERTSRQFNHATATARAAPDIGFLLILRHDANSPEIPCDRGLHDTPDAANFAIRDTDLAKGPTARIPAFVGNGYRATVPAAGATACVSLFSQAMQ